MNYTYTLPVDQIHRDRLVVAMTLRHGGKVGLW